MTEKRSMYTNMSIYIDRKVIGVLRIYIDRKVTGTLYRLKENHFCKILRLITCFITIAAIKRMIQHLLARDLGLECMTLTITITTQGGG